MLLGYTNNGVESITGWFKRITNYVIDWKKMSDPIKQVIVMRKDLGMRKGKMIAQGGHAVQAFLLEKWGKKLTKEEEEWKDTGQKLICVSVDSEEELIEIFQQAKAKMLTVEMIKDSGRTEFDGVPTLTCLAIGPNRSSKIDSITGNLKLL